MNDAGADSATQPSQSAVYRRYMQLQAIRVDRLSRDAAEGLAGLLLTCVGFDRKGAEMALAMVISGGTFLGIDPSTEHLKTAIRNGSCDFMVNTLDESLRVLKNELRKKNALSVGLLGEAAAILPAMVARGVQPDLVVDIGASKSEPAMLTLIERGALHVDGGATNGSNASDFVEVVWTAANLADLRRMDELALRLLPTGDVLRQRWLRQAPAYFHRQRPLQRVLAMNSQEVSNLAAQLNNAISAGEIERPAMLMRQTAEGLKENILQQH